MLDPKGYLENYSKDFNSQDMKELNRKRSIID